MKLNQITAFTLSSTLVLGGTAWTWLQPGVAAANQLNLDATVEKFLIANQEVRSGTFVTTEQSHPTTGTARIVQENGQRYLEFDSGFDTATGPDVQVVLHRNNTVPVNLNEADYITLAALQSFSGPQRYAIPADLDLTQFQAVAIWCREFNVTFGYASL